MGHEGGVILWWVDRIGDCLEMILQMALEVLALEQETMGDRRASGELGAATEWYGCQRVLVRIAGGALWAIICVAECMV